MSTTAEQEGSRQSPRLQVSLANLMILVLAAGVATGLARGARETWGTRTVPPGYNPSVPLERTAGVALEVAAVLLIVLLVQPLFGLVARFRSGAMERSVFLCSIAWRIAAIAVLVTFVAHEWGVLRIDFTTSLMMSREWPGWREAYSEQETLLPICGLLSMLGLSLGMGAGGILEGPASRRPRPYWLFVPLATLVGLLFLAQPGWRALIPQLVLLALEAVTNAMRHIIVSNSRPLDAPAASGDRCGDRWSGQHDAGPDRRARLREVAADRTLGDDPSRVAAAVFHTAGDDRDRDLYRRRHHPGDPSLLLGWFAPDGRSSRGFHGVLRLRTLRGWPGRPGRRGTSGARGSAPTLRAFGIVSVRCVGSALPLRAQVSARFNAVRGRRAAGHRSTDRWRAARPQLALEPGPGASDDHGPAVPRAGGARLEPVHAGARPAHRRAGDPAGLVERSPLRCPGRIPARALRFLWLTMALTIVCLVAIPVFLVASQALVYIQLRAEDLIVGGWHSVFWPSIPVSIGR